MKRILTILVAVLITISSINIDYIDVSAKGMTNATMRSKVGCSKDNMDRILAVIDLMKADGYSSAAIAGALGNSWSESGWNPESEGMWGITASTQKTYMASKYYKNCEHKTKDNWCRKGVCTTAFAMASMKDAFPRYADARDKYSKFVTNKKNQKIIADYKIKKSGFANKSYSKDYKNPSSYKDFKKGDNPYHASISWAVTMERCAGTYLPCGFSGVTIKDIDKGFSNGITYGDWFLHEFCEGNATIGRPAKAGVVYNWLTGGSYKGGSSDNDSDTVSETTKETAVETAKALVTCGYWSESQLSSYLKLSELDLQSYLDNADIEGLEENDPNSLNSLNNWKTNIEANNRDTGLIGIMRKGVSLMGILFTVWVIFIYLAFWFDKINSLWDVNLLNLLTFGRLTLSPDEDDCTFSLSTLGKQDKRTVNHKAIIKICTIGLVFGVMLITGKFYTLLRNIWHFGVNLFNIIF